MNKSEIRKITRDLYLWLCRCYGPYSFSRKEFNYWVKYFLGNRVTSDQMYLRFKLEGWIMTDISEVRIVHNVACELGARAAEIGCEAI